MANYYPTRRHSSDQGPESGHSSQHFVRNNIKTTEWVFMTYYQICVIGMCATRTPGSSLPLGKDCSSALNPHLSFGPGHSLPLYHGMEGIVIWKIYFKAQLPEPAPEWKPLSIIYTFFQQLIQDHGLKFYGLKSISSVLALIPYLNKANIIFSSKLNFEYFGHTNKMIKGKDKC